MIHVLLVITMEPTYVLLVITALVVFLVITTQKEYRAIHDGLCNLLNSTRRTQRENRTTQNGGAHYKEYC